MCRIEVAIMLQNHQNMYHDFCVYLPTYICSCLDTIVDLQAVLRRSNSPRFPPYESALHNPLNS